MTEVTIVFLDETFSSTAVGPMEVFRHAGALFNYLTGTPQQPRFHVTTASVDGRAVRCDGPISIRPDAALCDVRKTDLIFIPTTGVSVEDAAERNAPVLPWLKRWHTRGAAIASTSKNARRRGLSCPTIAVIRMCSPRWNATTAPNIASHRNNIPASSSDQMIGFWKK